MMVSAKLMRQPQPASNADPRGTAIATRETRSDGEFFYSARTVGVYYRAERIGAPRSVRAVAQVCAANPLDVPIPCHRVVRHPGALSGYRWGFERKRALLTLESGR